MLLHPFMAPKSLKSASVIALAALSLSVTDVAAAQAPISAPPAGGPTGNSAPAGDASSGGELASPGDPFWPSRPDGKGGGRKPRPERALPPPTKGMSCELGQARNGIDYISILNETGATIPAGSKVTIFIQPGNVARTLLVEKDWPAGQTLGLALKGLAIADGADCSVRIKLAEAAPPADTPDYEDSQTPMTPQSEQFEDFGKVTGDTGPLVDYGDPTKLMSAACLITPDGQVHLFNSGNMKWPNSASFEVTLPNGQVFTVSEFGAMPDGNIQIPDDLIYSPGYKPDAAPFLPDDWTCEIKASLPA